MDKLIDRVAEVLQDRDAEAGECASYWKEKHEATRDYYRKSARKAIPIIAEEIKSGLEDGNGEWHDVPEAGGECYCIYKHSWQSFWAKHLGEV